MLLGVGIAAVLAAVFTVIFVAGERLFPTTVHATDPRRSGEWKRRAEIREYLSAIGERYVEDARIAGHRVAFYLPERDVAITFDARAFFRLEQSPTYAILVEHELPGGALGSRLPFETPRVARPGTDGVGVAFATLGLPPGATLAEVKAAYRERVKEVHPDHGGDEERFRRLREAYTAAKQHAS